jgi:hypothetical protein
VIYSRSRKQRVLIAFAALALFLRIAVPVGFMPSSLAGGWYLELCPDGLPVHVMAALFGEHHAHHGAGSDNVFYECDYGGGAAGAYLADCSVFSLGLPAAAAPFSFHEVAAFANTRLSGFRPRAPPSVVRGYSKQT